MEAQFVLALDQGTTNTKAILLDHNGQVVRQASRALSVTYPQPAWVEQDPLAIWASVREVIDEIFDSEAAAATSALAAIGVSNQRESVVLWERATGAPVGPCVIWQCQRGAALCQALRTPESEALVHARTGLTLDAMFSASKMRWLLDQAPDGHSRAAAASVQARRRAAPRHC